MRLEIINHPEKDRIIKQLKEQFGIQKLPFLLIRQGREKIRAFTGGISREELSTLARNINLELVGIYFLKSEHDGIRLSIDACNLLKEQITKNILKLNDLQALEWMKGRNIEIDKSLQGYKIIQHNSDFLGTGKASNGILLNYVPKDRRIRN